MKKRIAALVIMGIMTFSMAACGNSSDEGSAGSSSDTAADTAADASAEDTEADGLSGSISVVSREDGSGTRGAFIELFGIEEENEDGEKIDNTTPDASVSNSTAVVMTNVAGNPKAIGYISLGSLDDSVKALKVDGAEASVENVKNDTYKISRPFNIAVKDDLSDVAQDFVDYIMSAEGQKIVEDSGRGKSCSDQYITGHIRVKAAYLISSLLKSSRNSADETDGGAGFLEPLLQICHIHLSHLVSF